MTNERIPYIDVAKGLLILIVILHHLPYVAVKVGAEDSFYYETFNYQFLYYTYFMPAFFLITGYCSKQSREFNLGNLVVKNLKTIILPAFTLGLLSSCIGLVGITYKQGIGVLPIEFAKAVYQNIVSIVKNGGNYWFLSALFVSKIMYGIVNYCVICRGRGRKSLFFIYLIFVFLGYFCFSMGLTEHWAIWHAFMLCIFLFCGQLLREFGISKKMSVGCITLFVVVTFFYVVILNRLSLPKITSTIVINSWREVPVFLILSFTGSVMIMTISRLINENSYLQFWGRNSLIVYGIHWAILFKLYRIVLPYIGYNVMLSLLTYIGVFFATQLVVYIFIKMLNLPYVRYSIGKF